METVIELCDALSKLRAGALGFTIAVSIAILAVRRRVPSRAERTRSTITALMLLALAIGSVAAEPAAPILHRIIILGASATGIIVVLRHALERARWLERMRAHIRLERRFAAARTAAEQANHAKSDFLVTMSHEIRTPLNALLASADFLLRTRAEPASRAHLTTIVNEGLRLGSILNEVLDLRRIEDGQMVLERLPFAPGGVARDVVELYGARAHEKRLELRLDPPSPAGLLVAGDPRRFQQVLVNLVDNAVKFTPAGSVTLSLTYVAANTTADSALLQVRVRDTGVGISSEQREGLFAPLARPGYAPMLNAGCGLGLVIAQRLVTLMGGEIVVRSDPGVGSEFSFSLPVAPIVVAGTDADDPTGEPTPTARRPRVLVVDDVAANRVMLRMFLDQHGFATDQADSGEEAVRLATQHPYDAVLMDINMPVVDGFTATRRIRAAEPPGRRTLILAVTASIVIGTREQCFAAGMDEHFTKPLELRKFCRTLTHLLAARSAGARAESAIAAGAAVTRRDPEPLSHTVR